MAIDLDAIKADLARATPGPWGHDTAKDDENDHENPDLVVRLDPPNSLSNKLYGNTLAQLWPGNVDADPRSGQDHRNAGFIARSRMYVEDLVAEVERHRRVLGRACDELHGEAIVTFARIVVEELGAEPVITAHGLVLVPGGDERP